jgi:hypothetical protein
MAELMTVDVLRQTGLAALEAELGPVEALRFLALVRREPFDYEAWRAKAFDNLTVDDLMHRLEEAETRR